LPPPCGLLIPEPRGHLVCRTLEEAALLAARALAPVTVVPVSTRAGSAIALPAVSPATIVPFTVPAVGPPLRTVAVVTTVATTGLATIAIIAAVASRPVAVIGATAPTASPALVVVTTGSAIARAFVATSVSLVHAPTPLGIIIAEPGPDFIPGPIRPVTPLAVALRAVIPPIAAGVAVISTTFIAIAGAVIATATIAVLV